MEAKKRSMAGDEASFVGGNLLEARRHFEDQTEFETRFPVELHPNNSRIQQRVQDKLTIHVVSASSGEAVLLAPLDWDDLGLLWRPEGEGSELWTPLVTPEDEPR